VAIWVETRSFATEWPYWQRSQRALAERATDVLPPKFWLTEEANLERSYKPQFPLGTVFNSPALRIPTHHFIHHFRTLETSAVK
jgi:hypothetical protein